MKHLIYSTVSFSLVTFQQHINYIELKSKKRKTTQTRIYRERHKHTHNHKIMQTIKNVITTQQTILARRETTFANTKWVFKIVINLFKLYNN